MRRSEDSTTSKMPATARVLPESFPFVGSECYYICLSFELQYDSNFKRRFYKTGQETVSGVKTHVVHKILASKFGLTLDIHNGTRRPQIANLKHVRYTSTIDTPPFLECLPSLRAFGSGIIALSEDHKSVYLGPSR